MRPLLATAAGEAVVTFDTASDRSSLFLGLFSTNDPGECFAVDVEYSRSCLFVAAGMAEDVCDVVLFHFRQ